MAESCFSKAHDSLHFPLCPVMGKHTSWCVSCLQTSCLYPTTYIGCRRSKQTHLGEWKHVSFQQQWLSAFQEVILGKWGLQVNVGPYLPFDPLHIAVCGCLSWALNYSILPLCHSWFRHFSPLSSRDKKIWELGLVCVCGESNFLDCLKGPGKTSTSAWLVPQVAWAQGDQMCGQVQQGGKGAVGWGQHIKLEGMCLIAEGEVEWINTPEIDIES